MGRASFLLAGDVESTGQILLLNQRPIPPSLVLKVPHHGGEDALFDGFIASAAPEIAIIQAGPAGSADPSPETLQRLQDVGARVFQTRRQGSVEIVTDGERYWVKQ
jgi:beta-lactamase superfamily II metal-dependent hydrolase